MGVKNINILIKRLAPNCIKNTTIDKFKGQTWAIDTSYYIYKYLYNSKIKKPNNHINGFYTLIKLLYNNGIKPILILDGKPPELKNETIEGRKEIIQNLKNTIDELNSEGNTERAKFLEKRIIEFPDSVYDDIKNLCNLMSVQVLQAESESDFLCKKLYINKNIDAVVSSDSDMLMYGINLVVRKLDYTTEIETINLNELLETLKLTHDQFVDLCILYGTDFNKNGVKGFSSLMSGYNSICQNITIDYKNIFPDYYLIKKFIINDCLNYNIDYTLNNNNDFSIDWNQLIILMTTKCNYREQTIKKHRDNFSFPPLLTPPLTPPLNFKIKLIKFKNT